MLFDQDQPADLTTVLQPAAIDFRVRPEYRLQSVRHPPTFVFSTWLPYAANVSKPVELLDGTLAAEQSRLVVITSNFLDQRCGNGAGRALMRGLREAGIGDGIGLEMQWALK